MPGLGPGIHVLLATPKVVDGRAKPGHDGKGYGVGRISGLLVLLVAVLALAACGKRGSPVAPGPADEITYPRVYPTR